MAAYRPWSEDPVVLPDDEVSLVAKKPRPSWPKRKVALMMGYCGTGYQGMQLNPNAKSIEKELFDALVKERLITEDNAADPKKVSWMRACRTDKGVHACGQVVSLKMLLRNEYEGLPEEASEDAVLKRIAEGLNGQLPEQIRIFAVKRTTGSFHAKERTDSRIYEYLLPTYVFRPVDPEPYTKVNSRTAEDMWGPMTSQISPEEKAKLPQWRLPTESLDRVRDMFKTYIGYHSYHNFTTGISFGEMKARRYIIDVAVGEPFVRDGIEWARVTFHGQSFMLHQIRKMVGLVIMAERIRVGAEIIEQCFQAARVNIPRAPALGLLLDRAIFEQYNDRNPDVDPIDFLLYEDERNALKDHLIYPKIFEDENEHARYWGWLKCNDDHAFEFSFLTLGPVSTGENAPVNIASVEASAECFAIRRRRIGMSLRNLIMSKNSYFLAAVIGTAFIGDIAADYVVDAAWRFNNKGKLWEDVERRLQKQTE